MTIWLEDLLASFRRHLRAAPKAPRTIELYNQSVVYFSGWLTDRGRQPLLDELTLHAISAWLAELAETNGPTPAERRSGPGRRPEPAPGPPCRPHQGRRATPEQDEVK
ncbi:hypothetical protein [Geodermatophilus sp. CPCC 205761]|uniref:hypothetical protein n=1 Tax=Geodermatophilus sp. CPCC 205761 TaxID=2936597 RepID=UPI003EEB6182